MSRTATLLFASLLLATPAIAQDTTTQDTMTEETSATQVQFVEKQSEEQDLASRFIGTPVINPAGETLGKVNDLVMDVRGQVEVIIIGVGGFLGIAEKNVGVRFDQLARIEGAEGEAQLVLDATQGDLTDAPEFLTADNKSLSLTQRLQERAGQLSEQAKQTYDKAKERVMEEAQELSQ